MTTRAEGFEDEDLLRQLGWVRRLAIELVREPAAADDVTQDVARIALERRTQFEGDERGLRAWLAAVVRRVVIDRRRSDQARRAREQRVARPEGDESALSIESRSERARVLAEVVQSLPDPYRATVLHRYFDELSIADVAARTGVDEPTARKRLSRAHVLLRERLDRRGEGEPRAWLASLVGVGIDRAVRDGVTSGTAATTVVATGVGLMGTKLVIGAVVCAAVVAVLVLRNGSEVVEPTPVVAEAGTDPASSQDERVAPIEQVGEADSARRLANQGATDTATEEVAIEIPSPKLLVHVVDADGQRVTHGVLSVWCRRTPGDLTRTFESVPIAGDITQVALPPETLAAVISASTESKTGSPPFDVKRIRVDETREITLVVGGELKSPALRGRVFVDGVQRVPRGLAVRMSSDTRQSGRGHVNVIEATWAVESVQQVLPKLVVTSEETVYAAIDLQPAQVASGLYDLELTSGRTLIVHLHDRTNGGGLPDTTFTVQTSIPLGGGFFAGDNRLARTNANGTARVEGIPLSGILSIRPDLDPLPRKVIFTDGVDTVHWGPGGWLEQRVTTADPDPFTVTLEVDVPRPGATAFGFTPAALATPDFLASTRVGASEVTDAQPNGDIAYEMPRDADGRWTLSSHWPSRHFVWIEDVKTRARRTEKTEVVLDAVGETGPIQLAILERAEFELEIVGVPAGGELSISIREEGAPNRSEHAEAKAGVCVQRIHLAKAARINVTWRLGIESDVMAGQIVRIATVDPAQSSHARFDFGADSAITVRFEPSGEPLPTGTKLTFASWDQNDTIGNEALLITPKLGELVEGVHLPPGRWIWSCFTSEANVAVSGVVIVGSSQSELRIAPKVIRVERAKLEKGLVQEELDGFDLSSIEERSRTWRFEKDGDAIVNEGMRWSPLP